MLLFWSYFMIFVRKVTERYGGRLLVERNFFEGCWVGPEGWVRNDDFICFLCREKFAVDTFVLCREFEGRDIIFSSSVTLYWLFSIKNELYGSMISKKWGMNSRILFTVLFSIFQLLFSEELSGGSSRRWKVLRWRLWSSASTEWVTFFDVV